jgi:hypothetical protein
LPGNSILLEEISSRFLCAAVKASLKLTTRLLSKPFVRQVYDYQWEGFLFFYDEFGRMLSVHNRYDGILYEVVK